MKIVFMGTPEIALPSLRALHQHHEIVGVYTQPDRPVGRGLHFQESPVKKFAKEHQLPVFQPLKLTLPGEFDRLKALNPEVIVVAAYGQILKKEVLELPAFGCVNVHYSLLPRWRGAAPLQHALLAGDLQTGVTFIRLVQKLDAGDILGSKVIPIHPDETLPELHDRISSLGEGILEVLEGLSQGSVRPQVQDESQVTYAHKLTKEMEVLSWWSETAVELERKVRALNPWPGSSVTLQGKKLKIKKAKAWSGSAEPGQLILRSGQVLLGAKEGLLELKLVQWEGKKEIAVAEFLNGLMGRSQALPLQLDKG